MSCVGWHASNAMRPMTFDRWRLFVEVSTETFFCTMAFERCLLTCVCWLVFDGMRPVPAFNSVRLIAASNGVRTMPVSNCVISIAVSNGCVQWCSSDGASTTRSYRQRFFRTILFKRWLLTDGMCLMAFVRWLASNAVSNACVQWRASNSCVQ